MEPMDQTVMLSADLLTELVKIGAGAEGLFTNLGGGQMGDSTHNRQPLGGVAASL